MGENEGRGRAAAARLRAISTPELYRRNPFRITGLTATATRREVRERRLRVLGVLEVGGARPPGVPGDASADEVRAAFDALGNAEHRFVDELFWTWGPPSDCGCPAQLHRAHDNAVTAYAGALDAEAERTEDHPAPLWHDAARSWDAALSNGAFRAHLVHRTGKLGDRRLDESSVDGLRAALPEALLAPLVSLLSSSPRPDRFVEYLTLFGAARHVVEDARMEAAGGTYQQVEELLKGLRSAVDGDQARTAADRLVEELPPLLDRLEEVVPREEFRRTAAFSEAAAVLANNIGVALGENGDAPANLLREVFAAGRGWTTDPDTLAALERNESAALAEKPWYGTPGRPAPLMHRSTAPAQPQASLALVLAALVHVAAGITFLAVTLISPLLPILLIGLPGLLISLGAAGNPRTGRPRFPVLLGVDAVLYLGVAHGSPASWVVVVLAVVLLIVAPATFVSTEREYR
ncbi:hypothetical protein [Amycolatopsis jiangsuensis]|uniref:Uncharacterized protein n=1 Tax=Amycolatopsis jiangsuensis TaxID=1181879 RepID=A0A840J2Y7_9PSEU|nr:hypothetical protein [Amycolatopsis jiangsuensis]MBB4688420.1 hypothetical protein [Amycolatopsis jiangsuensis]